MARRFAVAVLAVAVLAAPGRAADETPAIHAVFNGYKSALQQKRGRDAVRFVHKRTVDYFGRVRLLAVQANRAVLEKQKLLDQLVILYMRLKFGERRLARMTAKEVFAVAVERGLIGSNIHMVGVGKVEMTKDGARAQASKDGKALPLFFEFRRAADKGWRLDLVNLMAAGDGIFEQMRRQQKMSKGDFVMTMLRATSRSRVPNDIWTARSDR